MTHTDAICNADGAKISRSRPANEGDSGGSITWKNAV